MPQQDADVSEPEEAEEVDRVPLAAMGKPPVVQQPGEQALDLPALDIATERGAPLLRSHRAALLEQVGLGDAAAFERGSAPGDR